MCSEVSIDRGSADGGVLRLILQHQPAGIQAGRSATQDAYFSSLSCTVAGRDPLATRHHHPIARQPREHSSTAPILGRYQFKDGGFSQKHHFPKSSSIRHRAPAAVRCTTAVVHRCKKPSAMTDGQELMLQGMRNTISTDLSNTPDFIAWRHAEDDEDTEEANARNQPPSENTPKQAPQLEAQSNIDEDDPDEICPATISMHPDTLSGATNLSAQIRQSLGNIPGINLTDNSPNQQLIEYLIKSVAKLSIENEMLKKAASDAGKDATPPETGPTKSQAEPPGESSEPVFKEFHVVYCVNSKRNYFHDSPRIFKGDLKSDHLRGLRGIENITTHLDRNKDLVFAIMHEYVCFCKGGPDYQRMVGYKDGRLLDDSPPAQSKDKFVMLNRSLRNAIVQISQKHPDRFSRLDGSPRLYCLEPFLAFYTFNKTFLELVSSSGLSDFDLKSITMLCTWFEENYRATWDETDELLSRGKITFKHYKRLFRPGELVVVPLKDKFGTCIACRVKPHFWKEFNEKLDLESWTFNGSFQKSDLHLGFGGTALILANGEEVTEFDGEVEITDLIGYPLRFAKPGLREQLIARGNRFWRCRKQTLVSYNHKDSSRGGDERPVRQLYVR